MSFVNALSVGVDWHSDWRLWGRNDIHLYVFERYLQATKHITLSNGGDLGQGYCTVLPEKTLPWKPFCLQPEGTWSQLSRFGTRERISLQGVHL